MESIRMPVVFVGHGSPMNAIEDNEFGRTWEALGNSLPRPKAIVCISAHWETRGTWATAMTAPKTIHDFYGFPRSLYEVQYPAPGAPALASRLGEIIRLAPVELDQAWGLDHGAWSVLRRMYPAAELPVIQLSLDRTHDVQHAYDLGVELRALRDEGVLILGSGNLVHNLRLMQWEGAPFDWAEEYDRNVKNWIEQGDHAAVIHYERHGRAAALAVNSAEHYLPLLYVLGASDGTEPLRFFNEEIALGSVSMRGVVIG